MTDSKKLFAFFAWPGPVHNYMRDVGGWKLGPRPMALFDRYFIESAFPDLGLIPLYAHHSEEETDWMDLLHNLLWVDSGGVCL
jgi:hypothetical protein